MARKKPARRTPKKAKKAAAARPAARKAAKKPAKKVTKKAARKLAKPVAKKRVAKPAPKTSSRVGTVVKKAAASQTIRKVVGAAAAAGAAIVKAALSPSKPKDVKKPNLDRPRKTVADIHGAPSSLGAMASASAAKSGRAEFKDKLQKNTSASPALTAGDVDADWQAAEAIGDEAPGGDNPTPDQDVVDEIGRALGVEYDDNEELQGGDEIRERDKHRWELDPSSKDDFDEEE